MKLFCHPCDGHTRDLPFSKRGNPGSCAPRLNTEFESAYWIYAPSTSPGTLGDAAGSSMPSSQILHVSAALSPKGTRERSSSRSDTVVDGVRAGAKRLGRKKERVTGSPLPQQPRAYVNHHQRSNINTYRFYLVTLGMISHTCHPQNHTNYLRSQPTSSFWRGTSLSPAGAWSSSCQR